MITIQRQCLQRIASIHMKNARIKIQGAKNFSLGYTLGTCPHLEAFLRTHSIPQNSPRLDRSSRPSDHQLTSLVIVFYSNLINIVSRMPL